jgi:PPOX class probable F420-dependent enzyme
VPVTFAVSGDTIYTAVDAKPKSTRALRRLANVAANPRVAVLVDHYVEDWDDLWWARADGAGRVLDAADPQGRAGIDLLVSRYPQYRARRPAGPVLVIAVDRWSSWASSPLR